MLTLFGNSTWTSPYVLSCFVTLREKHLPFEMQEVALDRRAQHAPDFARASLTSRVPMLVDGDFALSESSAIVEYLEDTSPTPRVLPERLADRARARQIMAWIRSDLMPIREERSAEYVFYPHDALEPFAPLSPSAERAVSKLFAVAEALVSSTSGPIFGAWCIADTDLAMMLQRLVKTGHAVPKALADYANAQWQRASVQEFVHHARAPFAPASL
jgi:glutathione S-transferase